LTGTGAHALTWAAIQPSCSAVHATIGGGGVQCNEGLRCGWLLLRTAADPGCSLQ